MSSDLVAAVGSNHASYDGVAATPPLTCVAVPPAPSPAPDHAPPPFPSLQVYQRVEATGEDFLQHFKSNFRVHLVSMTEEEVV